MVNCPAAPAPVPFQRYMSAPAVERVPVKWVGARPPNDFVGPFGTVRPFHVVEAVPPPRYRCPPWVVTLRSCTPPPPLLSLSAQNTTFSGAPAAPLIEIPLFITTLRCDLRVSVVVPEEAVLVTLAATVISPLPPVLASVAMVTLPLFSAVPSVAAPILLVVWAPLPLAMVKSTGSSSHSPIRPCGARVLMRVLSSTCSVWPEVSMRPPLPLCAPPLARMLPDTCVRPIGFRTSLHNTAVPPSPRCVALTSMLAPVSTVVLVACFSGPDPCQPPPTSTSPPPVAPEAVVVDCPPG